MLKLVNLIDSPGMIDAAQAQAQRDYDFSAAVRTIAEISDLVLFLFDPDKPGTTGEAISTVKDCLTGMEFKLRILMNKADTFDSMYDFARAYGALCWNLARALHTKDLPPVYTTYIPVPAAESSSLDLRDFDRYRNDVAEQVRSAQQRRADNMIAALRDDMSRLAVHVRVLTAVRQKLFWLRTKQALIALLCGFTIGLLAMVSAYLFGWESKWLQGTVGITSAIAAVAAVAWFSRRKYALTRESIYGDLDAVFNEQYTKEITRGQCDDLLAYWHKVREVLPGILNNLDSSLPLRTGGALRRLERAIQNQVNNLKADD